MEKNNLYTLLAFVVVLIVVINLTVTVVKISIFNKEMTGYAASGYVNLTVSQSLVINLSRDQVNFGPGVITSGCQNVTMWTAGEQMVHNGCGNWSDAKAIIIQNLGSINFTLSARAAKNADDFFGTSGNPSYQWNFSNKEASTCGEEGNITLNEFYEINKSLEIVACKNFSYYDNSPNHNEMYLDILVRVPSTNNITDGNPRYDIITLSATSS